MMMVETELRPSPIHGLGVFLLRPVRRGDLVWRFDARIDRVYTPEEVATLPGHVQAWLETYCTWHEGAGVYVLCGDNGRYFNHAEDPSTVSDGISFGEDRAARDLAVGDELTSDYRTICDRVRRNGNGF
ncbi:SET domain-containing protein [Phenylobacterium soli]|uniref:SET domain-containing protein n=1 Tax=Phenylobacterium soli TaxID=2170551 RepID=UPI001403CACF|nr:SET domain-containing protein [Phenylobacterium soli]